MRRGWTPFLLSASVGILGIGAMPAISLAQTLPRTLTARKANELTLAGLRPGRSKMTKARNLFRYAKQTSDPDVWSAGNPCTHQILTITAEDNRVQTIRVSNDDQNAATTCDYRSGKVPPNMWVTGRGLAVGDYCSRAESIYGKPNSRSPSTKDEKPLELLYYAFDWAGPDVPQVMEVVCTAEKDGKPGRIVEITLAAPSL